MLLAFFCMLNNIIAQNTPQILSDKVKVVFPGKPEMQKLPNGIPVYYFAKDTISNYLALGIDLSAMGISGDMVNAMGDALLEQMKGHITNEISGIKILKDQVTPFKGKSSLYLELDGTGTDLPQFKGKKAIGYSFFIGSVFHQVMFLTSSANVKPADAQSFFDSVEIAN